MVAVLDLLAWGCCDRLKTLDVAVTRSTKRRGFCRLSDDDAACVGRALLGGSLRRLEELKLSNCEVTLPGLHRVTEALGQGTCPALRRLELPTCREGAGVVVAEVLASGHFRRLQELDVSHVVDPLGGVSAIHHALCPPRRPVVGPGACPDLRKLSTVVVVPENGFSLEELITDRGCPRL